jgi:diacylglycerol kinase (ATP)
MVSVASLEVNGEPVKLSENICGLIIMNINSYAGGADLWGKSDEFNAPSSSDGLLEVVGIKGAMELGATSRGLTKPKKLAQAKTLKLVVKNSMPVQVDGEPWKEPEPFIVTIKLLNQATMLTPS